MLHEESRETYKTFNIKFKFFCDYICCSLNKTTMTNSTVMSNYSVNQLLHSQGLFDQFFVNHSGKSLIIAFSILLNALAIWVAYGIIWYEKYGTDLKQTLLNKLVSSICWSGIYYFLLCQYSDLLQVYVLQKSLHS